MFAGFELPVRVLLNSQPTVENVYAFTHFWKKNSRKWLSFYSKCVLFTPTFIEILLSKNTKIRLPPPEEHIKESTSSVVHCSLYGYVVCVVLSGTGQQGLMVTV